jgi:hypothetical protein
MPIKKRGGQKLTYNEFRALAWDAQPHKDKINFRGNKMADGSKLPFPVLQPKPHLHYKDQWHCPDNASCRKLLKELANFPEIRRIEVQHSGDIGSWIYVDWNHQGIGHLLPGQDSDDRGTVIGRR